MEFKIIKEMFKNTKFKRKREAKESKNLILFGS